MAGELAVVNSGAMQPYDGGRLPAVQQLGAMLAKSGYFADAREAAQAAVKVMAGEELGLAPVASMMGINIIKGKVALSANLMAAQVRRHGYNYLVKSMDAKGCILEFIGKDGKPIGESSFNEEDARNAGVLSDMYKKYPRNMYFSRAMSNGVKWFCPEVTSGLPIYTPEELGAQVNGEGEMIQGESPIDTGGHPMNTQAAADAVAQRKIAEMQKKQKTETSKDFSMLESFSKMKAAIGDKAYYIILGNNGYEKSNQITDKATGKRIWAEMEAYRRSTANHTPQPAPEPEAEPQPAATMTDLPDELWPEGRE